MSSENKLIYSGEACRMIRNSKEDNPYAGTMAEAVWKLAHDSCLSCVEACTAVDAVEVVHGHWVDANGIRKSKCGNCGVEFGRVMGDDCYYCPTCGAKMDGEC